MRCRAARRSSVLRPDTECAPAKASRGASSPAKPSRRLSRPRAASSRQGLHLTLDYLGESVRTLEEADAATREYVRLLDVIVASGIERNISLKLTQLGRGRRPRDVRRQPAAHPRTGGPSRFLRAHRHGKLAVDAVDAGDFRDVVAAGVPERRYRAASGALSH